MSVLLRAQCYRLFDVALVSIFQGTQRKKIIISDDYDFNNSVSYIHRHMTPVANKSNYSVLVQLDVYY